MLALLPLALSSQSAAWFNYWLCGRNNMKWRRIADDCCIFAHKVGTDSIPFLQKRSQVSQVLFAEICAHWSISTSGGGLWESDFLGQRTKDSWTPTSRHVCDVCDRDIMGYWMMRDICLIFGDWMCMDLRCCLDRNILYICIGFDWKLKQRRCAIQSKDEPYRHNPVFFQFTEAVAERATARCWQRRNPGVRCCAQLFFVHGQRWALPQVACLQSSYTVLRQKCCKCSHEPTIEALDLPNRWEATCNGGDLSIFAWIVGLRFNGPCITPTSS